MVVGKVGGRKDVCVLGGGGGWVLRLMLMLMLGDWVLFGAGGWRERD